MQVLDSGSTLMTGSDQTVETNTTVGTLIFRVDTSPLQAGDTLDIWTTGRVTAGGTQRIITEKITLSDVSATGEQIVDVEPFANLHTFECHLQQTAGVMRTITWELIRL